MSKVKMIVTTLIAVFALSAIASASASAGEWMVGGTSLTGSEALATTAKVDENGVLVAAGVTITCEGGTLNGVKPQIEEAGNKGSVESLEFTGCSAAGENCKLAGQNAGGTIGTLPIHVSLELQPGSSSIVLATFLPNSGTTFATIAFTGSGCSLSGKQPVNGKALVEGPTGQEEKVTQEIKAITSQASGLLKVGGDSASLAGAALLKLVSEKTWSYL